jgi:tetratricopeptide (TPR) repeat protein
MLMGSKQFTLHKIAKALNAAVPVNENTIARFEKYNSMAGVEAELSLQYILQAEKLTACGHYIEAVSVYEKAISAANGDPSIKFRCRNQLRNLAEQIQNLAIDNISDVRIGPLYDYFYKIGHVPMLVHAYAALHFKKIGESEKARAIALKIKKVAPNFRLLKTKEK